MDKRQFLMNMGNMIANHLNQAQTIREQAAAQHYTSGTKHTQAWDDFGYPQERRFEHYHQMYLYFGPAKAGINMPVDTCWKTNPTILEGDDESEAENRKDRTAWERELDKFIRKQRIWKKARAADKRQAVGQYGALIVQIRGSKDQADWGKPLKGKLGPENIVKFIPVYQAQLQPTTYELNPSSERYGQPIMYNFQENNLLDNREEDQRLRSVPVHHSRVIPLAEGADDDSIYGVPALEAGFNHLLDMIKIAGGGAEGIWQNSKLKVIYSNIDKDSPMPEGKELEEMEDAIEDFIRKLDDFLITGGLKPELLQARMPSNPDKSFEICLGMFSSSLPVMVPQNMLMGSQTGVLASDKDGSFFLSNCQSRRVDWCSQVCENIIDWLMDHGVIERRDYIVQWDDLMAMSEEQKVKIAGEMAKVNKDSMVSGGPVYSVAEMRQASGYEAEPEDGLDEGELTEEDDPFDDDQ